MKIEKDLSSNVKVLRAIDPVVLGTTGNNVGKIIDRQGYGGVLFTTHYGAVTTTGTVVTAVMKEGDATGSMTSVADADMVGTEAGAGLAATTPRTSGTSKLLVKKVQYKGSKRYVSLDLNHTGATSLAVIEAAAVLFNPDVAPTT